MRISDWSSDVCSSDLLQPKYPDRCPDAATGQQSDPHAPEPGAEPDQSGPQSGHHQLPRIALARADHSEDRHTDGAGAGHPVPRRQSRSTVPLDVSSELRPGADRKSVVSGKSVSVRVDLGGRRIIKKTNKLRHKKLIQVDTISIDI